MEGRICVRREASFPWFKRQQAAALHKEESALSRGLPGKGDFERWIVEGRIGVRREASFPWSKRQQAAALHKRISRFEGFLHASFRNDDAAVFDVDAAFGDQFERFGERLVLLFEDARG